LRKALQITLGIVTSIGGFLDAGAIATAAQAGSFYGFSLIWAVLAGAICLVFLMEMSGRLAVVSGHPLREAIHHRFGSNFSLLLLVTGLSLNLLTLASEIGGLAIALQLLTGVSFRIWALPVALLVWLLIWSASFRTMENVISGLGLITLAFFICAWQLRPPTSELLAGLLPPLPLHQPAAYWYLAVSVIGAIISPYALFFYSSGTLEEKWERSHLGVNRVVSGAGMAFGAVLAVSVVICAAQVLHAHGLRVSNYSEAAGMLSPVFGRSGPALFAICLAVCCFGAASEVSLSSAYETAQTLGWNWGMSQKARHESRFSVTYSVLIFIAALPVVAGVNPLALTTFTMALTCVELPLVTFPFIILMNDPHYVGRHINQRWANVVVVGIIGLAFLVAIVAIPLQLAGGA
jgi:Mn2+/Fe2+ NRAMP family transporter